MHLLTRGLDSLGGRMPAAAHLRTNPAAHRRIGQGKLIDQLFEDVLGQGLGRFAHHLRTVRRNDIPTTREYLGFAARALGREGRLDLVSLGVDQREIRQQVKAELPGGAAGAL